MKHLNQVKDYHGKRASVCLKNGNKVEGALSFYNWEQQVVYLSSYVIFGRDREKIVDKGKFIVINQREWSTLRIKE